MKISTLILRVLDEKLNTLDGGYRFWHSFNESAKSRHIKEKKGDQ